MGARSKPPMVHAKDTPRPYYRFCHHVDANGVRCCAETENGRHACPKCLALERPVAAPRYNLVKSYI